MGVDFGNMTSAHFIFIPAVLLVGIVIGWILGSRSAADAYAAELKKRDARRAAAAASSSTTDREPTRQDVR
jgi:hypothetical protein